MRIICLLAILFSVHITSVSAQEKPSDDLEQESGEKKKKNKKEKKSKGKSDDNKEKKGKKDKGFHIDDLINSDAPSTLAPATDSSFTIEFDGGTTRPSNPDTDYDFDDADRASSEKNFGEPDSNLFFTGDLALEERRKYDDEQRRAPIPDKIPKVNRTKFLTAQSEYKKKQYDEALAYFLETAKPYHTNNANLNYHIGLSYLNSRLEDRTKAVLHLEKAIKNTHKKAI
jgi:tetratricopeptide (TPR) repeat protein